MFGPYCLQRPSAERVGPRVHLVSPVLSPEYYGEGFPSGGRRGKPIHENVGVQELQFSDYLGEAIWGSIERAAWKLGDKIGDVFPVWIEIHGDF